MEWIRKVFKCQFIEQYLMQKKQKKRIRTYNFPQSRVTDHRIGLTLYKLEQFMNGDCDEVFDALAIADRTAKLAAGGND